MRITLVGSRHFGVTTFNMLRQHGIDIVRVVVHDGEDRMAATAKTDGQMSVLVPLCVTQFIGTDGAVAKLKLTQYGHDDVVREFVKKVVDTEMDYSFARACASGVDDALAKTAAKG